jgi:predicted NAD/FAD-dependent oxidoreductase
MSGGSSPSFFHAFSDLSLFPHLSTMFQDVPVRPCFALMLAFSEPLAMVQEITNLVIYTSVDHLCSSASWCFIQVPVQGFSFYNSDSLSWAFCDSSKPGRACATPNRYTLFLLALTFFCQI